MRRVLLLFTLIGILFSCGRDDDNEVVISLDDELKEILIQASGNNGLDFFKMPQSDDFQSIPQDPNNPITTDKVALGQLLYHETGLAINPKNPIGKETFSCATCHFASAGFQANRHQGLSEGGLGFGLNGEARILDMKYLEEELDVQPIRTPSAMNGAYQEVMLWNGQFGATGPNEGTEDQWTADTPIAANRFGYQGLETQAIAGLNVHRLSIEKAFLEEEGYIPYFDKAFPDIPEAARYSREYAGLAIAAYERTLFANQAPFQHWLDGDLDALSEQEKRGAVLFFGKAECNNCHTGPTLNSMDFYALGMKDLYEFEGEATFLADINSSANLGRGGFTKSAIDNYKFKVPQLYNLSDSPFYGHGSSFKSIEEIIRYKNEAIPENSNVPNEQLSEHFHPLNLTDEETTDIAAFIENGLRDNNLKRYEPSSVLSGYCFPNNDVTSKDDLGCN